MKKILIVGGGTAGWMSALLLSKKIKEQVQITLIESSDIGIIGVGEGTTPFMKQFFRDIDVAEHQWMPECQATYKCGIRFPNWSTIKGYQSYYHPFYSPLDKEIGKAFFHNANLRRRGTDVPANPTDFFVAPYMSESSRVPFSETSLPFDMDYAYHFDAGLLGKFLQKLAVSRGIKHVVDTIDNVELQQDGDIAWVNSAKSGKLTADYYIDCSGFSGLLIEKSLKCKFHSFSDNLLNNAAVAIQTPQSHQALSVTETRSEALSNGWMWNIPLTQRQGNGYVYSTDFITPEQAETELREKLGIMQDIPAKHLKMRVGRREQHWFKNCMAVGLSQGFIEPLEATALMLVQYSIDQFAMNLNQLGHSTLQKVQDDTNQKINMMFDGIRDYIVAHYKTNSRTDSEYWKINRHTTPVSDRLAAILDCWKNGEELEPVLQSLNAELVYLRPSWYCLLAGMGQFPSQLTTDQKQQGIPLQPVQQYCNQTIQQFVSQSQRLTELQKL